MKLIKLSVDHFVIVDDSRIEEGDWFSTKENIVPINYGYNYGDKKITHSTQPLGFLKEEGITTANLKLTYGSVQQLSLSEIKELIGEVDLEKYRSVCGPEEYYGFVHGYNQALEDGRKYTNEDMQWALYEARYRQEHSIEEIIQALQPKTEWDVEIVDGKLKLK